MAPGAPNGGLKDEFEAMLALHRARPCRGPEAIGAVLASRLSDEKSMDQRPEHRSCWRFVSCSSLRVME
jgi:hypothetical protein